MKDQKIIKIYVVENGYAVCPVGYGQDFPREVFQNMTQMLDRLPGILTAPEEGVVERGRSRDHKMPEESP